MITEVIFEQIRDNWLYQTNREAVCGLPREPLPETAHEAGVTAFTKHVHFSVITKSSQTRDIKHHDNWLLMYNG